MLDDYQPPTLRDRLLHPVSISMILLVLAVGGFWGWSRYQKMQRAAIDAAIEPLEAEWEQLRAGASPRLARLEAALAGAPAARRCEGVEGVVEVVHRPVLQALVAGERFPDVDGPSWLSSDAYRSLAGSTSPSRSVEAYRRRSEEVAEALDRACVAVLETEVAEQTRLQGKDRFEGGTVVGWLRVVCLDPDRIAGQVRVASQPWMAVAVQQRDPGVQRGANAMAVVDSARRDYWRAVNEVMAEACPGVTVRSRAPRDDEG